jgi:hypothetical protein
MKTKVGAGKTTSTGSGVPHLYENVHDCNNKAETNYFASNELKASDSNISRRNDSADDMLVHCSPYICASVTGTHVMWRDSLTPRLLVPRSSPYRRLRTRSSHRVQFVTTNIPVFRGIHSTCTDQLLQTSESQYFSHAVGPRSEGGTRVQTSGDFAAKQLHRCAKSAENNC